MAYGTELVFEVSENDLRRLLTGDELAELDDPEAGEDDFPDGKRRHLTWVAGDKIAAALRAAHADLVRARFDPDAHWVDVVRRRPDPNGGYLRANTPEGPREFSCFAVDGFGHEDECDSVLGISVWSRYSPVWVDWKYTHGGSGDPLRLDAETMELVEEARARLAEVFPAIATAPLTVVHQWY